MHWGAGEGREERVRGAERTDMRRGAGQRASLLLHLALWGMQNDLRLSLCASSA